MSTVGFLKGLAARGASTRVASWLAGRPGDVMVALSLAVTLVVARTIDASTTLWLQGDQIRDWAVALRPVADLPLAGPPSVAGGNSLGPFYYWLLWAIRVTIGPWFDNLPHAGVYGLAVFHAAADLSLFFAVRKLSGSAVLALATLLLLATAPFDLALSSTVWSPPVAVSLVKIALALFLSTAHHPSRWRTATTVAVAWTAVQTHSSAVLVFLPLASWFVARELAARRWRGALETIRVIVEVVLILQIPYVLDRVLSDAPRGAPTMIAEGITALAADPGSARPWVSASIILKRIARLWAMPFDASFLPWILAGAALGTLTSNRRRPDLLFVTILPFAIAVIGFAAWTRPMALYWFLGLAPALALMIATGVYALPNGRARGAAALVVLAVILYAQPSRATATLKIHRMPEYGPLLQGTRAIARRTKQVGNIETAFALPPTTPAGFLFQCMGGVVTPSAPYDALIAADGSVTFRARR